MSKRHEINDLQAMYQDEYVAKWMEEHAAELKQAMSGQRILYEYLALAFVIGLAAHIGGYYLLLSVPREPLGLLADLLHALGWSLWTGVVVTVFNQVMPEAKRRQIKQALAAYEKMQRDKK